MWQSTGLRFADDHPTGAGHFPGNPIIPGALLLDAIIAAIADRPDGDASLVIRAAKFLRPVRPGAALALRWQQGEGGSIRFECRLADDDAMAVSGTLAPGTLVAGTDRS